MEIEGFTQDEIDFMENVPNLLAIPGVINGMLYAALLYNVTFNTLLTEDQFHDRFDDYMVLCARTEGKKSEDNDGSLVNEFMKNRGFTSPSIRELLEKYDEFRNRKIEENARNVLDTIQPQIDVDKWFNDNFTNNFKFISSWRFW